MAVLPFSNFSADAENEYFADGITEDVIAHLSKIRSLKVISRTSVMPFKKREQSLTEIGATLGATTLLEGSVRRAGDRVRIVAQLIDAETDQHLWAETYDRQLTDIFAIQTDVALQIAAALKAELTRAEESRVRKEPTTEHPGVPALSLRATIAHQVHARSDALGDRLFRPRGCAKTRPTRWRTPARRMAYVELAEIGAMASDTAFRHAADAAHKALALDPELGDAHVTAGYVKMTREFDWAGVGGGVQPRARAETRAAPMRTISTDAFVRRRSATTKRSCCSAVPRSWILWPTAWTWRRRCFAPADMKRRSSSARAATDLDPSGDRAHATLGWALFFGGARDEGLAELETAVSLSPSTTSWLGQLGEAYGLAGRLDEARAVLRKLEERARASFVSPYTLAYVYTGLGDADRAIELLQRAVAERTGAAYGIKGSFLFRPLREHPKFRALLREMRLS